jgi:hypothetical protein
VDGQSCAPIDLHKMDALSDWLLIKHHAALEKNKNKRLAGSPVTKLIRLHKLPA